MVRIMSGNVVRTVAFSLFLGALTLGMAGCNAGSEREEVGGEREREERVGEEGVGEREEVGEEREREERVGEEGVGEREEVGEEKEREEGGDD